MVLKAIERTRRVYLRPYDKIVQVVCDGCGDLTLRGFYDNNSCKKRGVKTFCYSCRGAVNVVCPICKKKFRKWKSQLVDGRTKKAHHKIYCSKKCKNIGLRVPWNSLTRGTLKHRWGKEFGERNLMCHHCGHDKSYNIIIHHKKSVKDGGSNDPSNLIPLCLNCHGIEHFKK